MRDTVDIDSKPTREDVFVAKVEVRGERPVLVPLDPQAWLSALGRIVGQFVTVRIERPKLRRSLAQNAYLWSVVYPDVLSGLRELAVNVGEECPFPDVDELHIAMKYMVLGLDVVRIPGTDQKLERPSTTTTLTTAQFANYIDTIVRWAGERGIPVRAAGEEVVA
jgi:hypothetical protein